MPRQTVNQRMSKALGVAHQTVQDLQAKNKTVDITPTSEETTAVVPAQSQDIAPQQSPIQQDEQREKELADDYTYARNTIHHLVEMGKDALEHLLPLAKESQSPRGFEVTHMLLKTTSEMAKDLIELHQRMDGLRRIEAATPGTTVNIQQNIDNVFTGTTTELRRMAREAMEALEAGGNDEIEGQGN